MANTLYRGFSTFNRRKKFRVVNFELSKQNLFNHLHIRKGEKLNNPNFGTIIWDMLFEPLTVEVKKAISDDIKTIVNYDPRLRTDAISIAEYHHGLQIEVELTFIETDQRDRLVLQFDRRTSST